MDVEESIRTGYLIDSAGDNLYAFFVGLLDDGASKRKGISLDQGGGQHVFEIDFMGWTGETGQWGSSPDPAKGPNKRTATGADRITRMNVFMNYLRVGQTDSITPARFEYGQYTPNGFLDDHLDVAVESPNMVPPKDESSIFDGSLTVVEIADLNDVFDGMQQTES
ncbi:hypothetical protein NGM07_00075 [Halorussus vallis]|uniref:hypothetical protein n=1 Tax=Halorussus vallis TaxID=2953749 RepID=UPI0020A0E9E1|nr:hypothetical protein [Halorussus vallis]USZ75669.1 hypothetical protein NGM07_19850 [Halorussus vallis]USZ75724.1 hypothetical protein NGM07_20130 [Halorussus vallis]USZ75742.1 hypothetical protein NGM07_00075 [Halorussus vallis]